mmetsp:Transcript_42633/g.65380  ORF Transcript_42633/g.65380 Transcript_42633/m.65380 type:complete len:216 (-) Transcript_42633:279-926(-)
MMDRHAYDGEGELQDNYDNQKVQVSHNFASLNYFSKSARSSESSTTMKRLTLANSQLSTVLLSSWRTTQDMMESGLLEKKSDKARAARFGPTAPCTRVGGKTTRPTAREDLSTPTVTSTTDSGSMTRLTATVSTAISMAPSMKATGWKTSSTDRVSRPGPMVPSTKVNTCRARSTAKAASPGLTAAPTRVSSWRTTSRAEANTTGPMAENTTECG